LEAKYERLLALKMVAEGKNWPSKGFEFACPGLGNLGFVNKKKV